MAEKNIYELAFESYAHACKMIQAMFETGNESFLSDHPVDVRVCLNQFDVVLQYSMMQIALADNTLDSNEINFISTLSKYCDFCDYLNQRGFENVTWEVLSKVDVKGIKEVVEKAYDEMISLAQDLIGVFAFIDAQTEHDYLSDFSHDVINIMTAALASDGSISEAEKQQGAVIFGLLNSIKEAIGVAGEALHSADKEDSNNGGSSSLRDFYVKKKK